jgi:hypothetical protein
VKSENNASDICAVLSKVYVRDITKKSSAPEWHKRFKVGRGNVEGDEGCDRPGLTEPMKIVHSERRLSIRAN